MNQPFIAFDEIDSTPDLRRVRGSKHSATYGGYAWNSSEQKRTRGSPALTGKDAVTWVRRVE